MSVDDKDDFQNVCQGCGNVCFDLNGDGVCPDCAVEDDDSDDEYEEGLMTCPIREQTGDGTVVGRCDYYLPDGHTCPRHGNVFEEVVRYKLTQLTTLENVMRKRKGLPQLGDSLL